MIIQKDKDPILDKKFFDLLFPIIFPVEATDPKIYNFSKNELASTHALLSTGSLLEAAISKAKGLTRHATIGRDFVDGSDAKSASVRWSSNNTSYSAQVCNIFNKKGLLRCVVYERLQDKFYYFLIPHRAYESIPKTSNIEIPFNLNGDPKRDAKCRLINWWVFEVSDFQGILKDMPATFEFVADRRERIKSELKALKEEQKLLKASLPKKRSRKKPKIDPSLQISIPYTEVNDLLQTRDQQDTQPISLSVIS